MTAGYTILTEALESRTLLSGNATAAATVLDTAVQSDRAQIHADLLKFAADATSWGSTLLSDLATIKADGVKDAKTLAPLIRQFRTDAQQMRQQLKADRLAEASSVLADLSLIASDRAKLLGDKGNATAVTADKAQLKSDRIKMQNDMVAGLSARLATRQAFESKINADAQAIITAAQADPNASAKLQADLQKWAGDKASAMSTMQADISKLIADRTQLATDLSASQSQT